MDQQPQVNYAPQPQRRRLGRFIRRCVVPCLLAAAVLLAGYLWGPAAWQQALAYRASRQCMEYTYPEEQLIYASDPNPDPFARREQNEFRQPPPQCWKLIASTLPPPSALPENPDRYLDSPFHPLSDAPVFLHRRNAPGKPERLVAVFFGGQSLGGKDHRVLCCRVIEPAGIFHRPKLLWESSEIVLSSFQWNSGAHAYAGNADPQDPSHFTLKVAGTIEGWLQPDDTVKLKL